MRRRVIWISVALLVGVMAWLWTSKKLYGRPYLTPHMYIYFGMFDTSSPNMLIAPIIERSIPAWNGPTTVRVVDAESKDPLPDAVARVTGTTREIMWLLIVAGENDRTDYDILMRADSEGVIRLSKEQLRVSRVDLHFWAPGHGPAHVDYKEGKYNSGVAWNWKVDQQGVHPVFLGNPKPSRPDSVTVNLYRVDWDTRVWEEALQWTDIFPDRGTKKDQEYVRDMIRYDEARWREKGGRRRWDP